MHKVEIRLTHEGNEDATNVFEVYTEGLTDAKGYAETAPMQEVAGNGAPIVMFLELNERVIVVAKGNSGRLVYDKEQNANVRVETDEEKKYRADLEARVAKHQADQAVKAAQARVGEAQNVAEKSQEDANKEVRVAEANRAKIEAEQAKNRAAASEQIPVGSTNPESTPVGGVQTPGQRTATEQRLNPATQGGVRPGNPASANTGPADSKQVKP